MTNDRMKRITAVIVGVIVASGLIPGRADDLHNLTGPTTDEEIVRLIRDLDDPSYEKRTFATRRLCAIGMPAEEKLRTAAKDHNVETALRARTVLEVLERLERSSSRPRH